MLLLVSSYVPGLCRVQSVKCKEERKLTARSHNASRETTTTTTLLAKTTLVPLPVYGSRLRLLLASSLALGSTLLFAHAAHAALFRHKERRLLPFVAI